MLRNVLTSKNSQADATHYRMHQAEAVAKKCNADDPDWTYEAQQYGAWFVVRVTDENGAFLGYL